MELMDHEFGNYKIGPHLPDRYRGPAVGDYMLAEYRLSPVPSLSNSFQTTDGVLDHGRTKVSVSEYMMDSKM
jgi:hypothetical protein